MSFVGQFGPTIQRVGLWRGKKAPLVFAAGFVTTSTTTFAAVFFIGEGLRETVPAVATGAVVAGVVALFVVEIASLVGGQPFSFGLLRQTPRRWGRSKLGVLFWGLDTGIPFSTVRSTMLPGLALLLSLAGLVPWFAGAVYAAGFVAAVLFFSRLPDRTDDVDASTEVAVPLKERMASVSQLVPALRLSAALVTAVVIVGTLSEIAQT